MVRILELFTAHPEGLTLSQIVNQLDLKLATVHDILTSLKEEDIIYLKNEKEKTYVIGPKLYIMGTAYLSSSNLLSNAQPYLAEIANRFNATIFLAKRSGRRVSYVYKYVSENAKITTKTVGDLSYLHACAAGKVYMAFDPKAFVLLETLSLDPITPYTLTSKEALLAQLKEIKTLGYAMDFRESEEHVTTLAIPVFNFENKVVGAICLSSLYVENEDLIEKVTHLKRISRLITERVRQIEVPMNLYQTDRD